jgi:hypothetical protein
VQPLLPLPHLPCNLSWHPRPPFLPSFKQDIVAAAAAELAAAGYHDLAELAGGYRAWDLAYRPDGRRRARGAFRDKSSGEWMGGEGRVVRWCSVGCVCGKQRERAERPPKKRLVAKRRPHAAKGASAGWQARVQGLWACWDLNNALARPSEAAALATPAVSSALQALSSARRCLPLLCRRTGVVDRLQLRGKRRLLALRCPGCRSAPSL